MDKNVTRNLGIAIAAGLTVSIAAIAASASPQPVAANTSLKVLSGDGRYLELDPALGRSLAGGLYGDQTATRDGPHIEDVLGMDDGPLYALLGWDVQADENGATRFRIVALDRSTLRILHSYDLPQLQMGLPHLLLSAHDNQLLLLTDGGMQTLVIHDDGSIEPTGKVVKAQRPLSLSASSGIYIDAHGKIIDGFSVFDRQGHLLQEVRPDSVLDAALKAQFSSVTRIKGSTDHYYGTILAASAGDRMVFTVGWDQADSRVPQAGVAVYDLNAGRVISSFYSEFPVNPGGGDGPGIQFSPDGRRIVIEQYEWLPRYDHPRDATETSRKSPLRTGKLAIYDADSGSLVGTVDLGPPSNPRAGARARVIDYSSDASQLYYWFDKHLSVIDLENAKLVSTTALPAGYDPIAVVGSR